MSILNSDEPTVAFHDWAPENPESFEVSLTAYIGSDEGGDDSDAFDFVVCTLDRLVAVYGARRREAEEFRASIDAEGEDSMIFWTIEANSHVVPVGAVFVVEEWQGAAVEAAIAEQCARTFGETWDQIGAQLHRWLNWEFGYRLDPRWTDRRG